jgi:hypothetical protein
VCGRVGVKRCHEMSTELITGQVQVADDGWWMCLSPVRCKRTSWAAQRTRKASLRVQSSPDEVGQCLVVGVVAGFDAQSGDTVIGGPFPVDPEVVGAGSRKVKRAWLAGRAGLANTGENSAWPRVLAATTSKRPLLTMAGTSAIPSGCAARWADLLGGRPTASKRRGAGGAGEVDQMGAFGLVEMQCAGQGVQPDFVRDERLSLSATSAGGAMRSIDSTSNRPVLLTRWHSMRNGDSPLSRSWASSGRCQGG